MKHFARYVLAFSGIALLSGCVVVCVGGREDQCPCCKSHESQQAGKISESKTQPKSALFNIDFGPWKGSETEQTGPAVIGVVGDYWNCVGEAFNDSHTEGELKWSDRKPCPIRVEMRNLGGGWGFSGELGVKSPMLDNFNYPANNKGGNSYVVLHDIPPGTYDLYIYGHGIQPDYFGDYAVKVGSTSYGRRTTFDADNSGQDTEWVENRQYVKFLKLKVEEAQNVEILIRPGNPVPANGRMISDAIIAGLQLARR